MANDLVEWWPKAARSLRSDKHIGPLVKQFPGEGLRCQNDLFHTLCRSIVGQQISVKAADAVWGRLEQTVKRVRPKNLLASTEEKLRQAGLSRMKASYMMGLAEAAGDLKKVRWDELDDAAAIKRLVELRGVGEWTADGFDLCTRSTRYSATGRYRTDSRRGEITAKGEGNAGGEDCSCGESMAALADGGHVVFVAVD